jgi:hypothetical protein
VLAPSFTAANAAHQLESLLYARVAVPASAAVVDDSFARTTGGLHADWSKGLPLASAAALVRDMIRSAGVLVGWQVDSDLDALGYTEAAAAVRAGERARVPFGSDGSGDGGGGGGVVVARVVDLCDHYRAVHGGK